MRCPTSKTLFNHWNQARGNARAPERRQLDPAALGATLPDVFILERQRESIRFRLAGTRICNLFGGELRGLAFRALFDNEAGADVRELVAHVFDEQVAAVCGVSALFPGRISSEGEMLLLPLENHIQRELSMQLIGALSIYGHRPSNHPTCVALDLVTFRLLSDVDAEHRFGSIEPTIDTTNIAAARRARFVVLDGGLR